jgi:hypothetical protein
MTPDKRDLYLITQGYRILLQLKPIDSHGREIQVNLCLGRSRIVSISCIVNKTE